MSRRSTRFCFAAGAALFIFGCKSSSDNAGDSACTTYGKALISFRGRCESSVDPAQESALVARYARQCQATLGLPGTSPDLPSVLSACAAQIQGASCNTGYAQLDACSKIPEGSLGNGSPCASDLQCASGSCSVSTGSGAGAGSCGTCQPAIADGAACDQGGACVPGDTCIFSASGATCQKTPALGDVGAACATNEACKAPNHCALAAGATNGSCAAPVAAGGACVESTDCASGLLCTGGNARTCNPPLGAGAACVGGDCAVGYQCDADLTCHAVVFVAPGGTCDGDERFCSQGRCPIDQTDTATDPTGTCPTIIADGQPCDPASTSAQCDAFAACVGGTCTLLPATCK